jgi:hypothetical protein
MFLAGSRKKKATSRIDAEGILPRVYSAGCTKDSPTQTPLFF